MKQEDVKHMIEQSLRAAILIGEAIGRLKLISENNSEIVYVSKLRNQVDDLLNMILEKSNEIYYENK